MKHILLILAAVLVLGSANQVSAQLIIRSNGHAELGTKPDVTDNDTITVLKIYGDETYHGAKGRITFGDSTYVAIGELGLGNSNQLWLHGKSGVYMTKGTGLGVGDTIAFFNPFISSSFNFNCDLNAHGVLVESDERYKEDIEPIESVLDALNGLAPVSYHLKSHRYNGVQSLTSDPALSNYYRALEQHSERFGFLAQNVKEVFPELVHTDMNGYMSVDYIGLIPILVQSINELRAELAAVKAEKEDETAVLQSPALAAQGELTESLNNAKLYQNTPNPWNSETVIRYFLPQNVTTADIFIYDMQGTQVKRIPANVRGESQVTITAHDLKAGMYLYALVADGKLIDSKKMLLTN